MLEKLFVDNMSLLEIYLFCYPKDLLNLNKYGSILFETKENAVSKKSSVKRTQQNRLALTSNCTICYKKKTKPH